MYLAQMAHDPEDVTAPLPPPPPQDGGIGSGGAPYAAAGSLGGTGGVWSTGGALLRCASSRRARSIAGEARLYVLLI